jgi:hypothetical protein
MTDDPFLHVYLRYRPRALRERDLRDLIARMHECANDMRAGLVDACQCRGEPVGDAQLEADACIEACVPMWRVQLRRACRVLRLPVPEVWIAGHRL